MTALADLDAPAFDYTDTSLVGRRLHERLRELRERSWIARADLGWLVLDREAVTFFLRTPKATFPGRRMLELQGVSEGPLYERMTGNLLDRAGEDHRRMRRLAQPAFTPPAADRHRPAMRAQLAELYCEFGASGCCEVVSQLAKPYPSRMIAMVMGAPATDAGRLEAWANTIQRQFDPQSVANDLETLNRAADEFQGYVRDLLEARRGEESDDLISDLLAATDEGDRLSGQECVDIVSSALVGGVDTTQSQLAHALHLFARHPEQWELLARNPELASPAVEEVLRCEPITPFTARIILEDVEHRGVEFPEGTLVLAAAAAANRDPEGWEAPDEFDITAERERAKPLTFGAGPHFCLGANLARAELQEAFTYLAPRMRSLQLETEPAYDTPFGVYGMRELRLQFEPGE